PRCPRRRAPPRVPVPPAAVGAPPARLTRRRLATFMPRLRPRPAPAPLPPAATILPVRQALWGSLADGSLRSWLAFTLAPHLGPPDNRRRVPPRGRTCDARSPAAPGVPPVAPGGAPRGPPAPGGPPPRGPRGWAAAARS